MRKNEHEDVVRDMVDRVVDWRGHNPGHFGSLLLYDELEIQRTIWKGEVLFRRVNLIIDTSEAQR
jgi:hypothetical protein